MSFRKESKQLCKTCGGSGVNHKKVLKDKQDRTMIADTYEKGEARRPLFENCKECKGSGWAMYASPDDIVVDGEKVKLSPEELRARYDVAMQ